MAEPGLAQRLRRHSRNSGMMIGVSMAAAMILCIAAFIWLYVQIGPLLSDFIPQETAEEPETIGIAGSQPTPGPSAVDDFSLAEIPPEPLSTPSPDDDEADDEATDDEDDDADLDVWTPTHQLRDGPNVNFRSGPNTMSEPHGSLPPGTPLEFLGEEEPASGAVWMSFEIEDGTQGWIRDVDVVEVENDDDDADDE
ncbi:MAG: SH3 domain-containing protein [Sphaerobacteraceae bacterium]|nr:MAG: SH3 domain-containing protein [Sphaerobacteraceae bacterium]